MKTRLVIIFLILLTNWLSAQTGNAIFLHHSTGAGVFFEGNVAVWIADYNNEHGTDLEITEFAYPDSPWGWENYPYDYWKLWVDGSCNNTQDNIQCLDKLCENYDLIIFKHCFPGAGIEAGNGNGDVTSPEKTLNNYKLQYRALLALFDQYPDNKFMVWTLAPLHRLATNSEQANRAAQFVDWVKNSWLTEDGNEHTNVFIFDFFGLVAEQNENPVNGQQYCLKYDYEGDHSGNDSHPNLLANETIGPIFAAEVASIFTQNASGFNNEKQIELFNAYVNLADNNIYYEIKNDERQNYTLEIYTAGGCLVRLENCSSSSGVIHMDGLHGLFLIRIRINEKYLNKKVIL